MTNDLEKYTKLAQKPGKTREEIKELVTFVSNNIKDNYNFKPYLDIIWFVVSSFSLISDEEVIDDLIRVVHTIESQISTENDRANCDYLFLIIHLRLGYGPKTVEYALRLISNEKATPLMKYVAYTELTNRAISCEEYEKGREFAHRGIELLDQFTGSIRNQYSIIIYGNLLCILSNTSYKKEFDEVQAKIKQIIADNPDDKDVQGLSLSINIDQACANIMSKGCSAKRVKEYCKLFNGFVCDETAIHDYFHEINGDVPVLNKMFEAGYYKECVQICRKIVDNFNCFSGHIDDIYAIIEKLHNADSTLFEDDVYNDYLSRYLDAMKKTAANNTSMMKRMVSEEFKIYNLHSEYESIRAKYETDSLTVCYNRPSFEMNASVFMGDHPEGSLVFIDMDGLKYTNDHFGHSAGDFLLKTFVSTVNNVIDMDRDRLYRYAGDEFILITSRTPDETLKFMRSMSRKFAKPFAFNTNDINISFSYGIAAFTEGVETDEESAINSVVKIADQRMYHCKKLHKKKDPKIVRM